MRIVIWVVILLYSAAALVTYVLFDSQNGIDVFMLFSSLLMLLGNFFINIRDDFVELSKISADFHREVIEPSRILFEVRAIHTPHMPSIAAEDPLGLLSFCEVSQRTLLLAQKTHLRLAALKPVKITAELDLTEQGYCQIYYWFKHHVALITVIGD